MVTCRNQTYSNKKVLTIMNLTPDKVVDKILSFEKEKEDELEQVKQRYNEDLISYEQQLRQKFENEILEYKKMLNEKLQQNVVQYTQQVEEEFKLKLNRFNSQIKTVNEKLNSTVKNLKEKLFSIYLHHGD